MKTFLEISGALFSLNVVGWGAVLGMQELVARWKARRVRRRGWSANVSASVHPGPEVMERWLAEVRTMLARQDAVKERRAQEAEAKFGASSRGEPK